MSNLVSISIQSCKSLTGAIMHNRQHKKLDYVKKDGDIFTYETSTKNLPDKDVFVYEQNQLNELKTLIKEKTGRTSQTKNYYVDGLISLGRDQFSQLDKMQQERLINKTFEFLRVEIRDKLQTNVKVCSFHFDEGHKNEYGEWALNPHIQFTFENVNQNTGKTIQRTLTKKMLKDLQTKVSEYYQEFGFQRGKDYKEQGEIAPKQVYWKDYKRLQLDNAMELQQQAINLKDSEWSNEIMPVVKTIVKHNLCLPNTSGGNEIALQLDKNITIIKQENQSLKNENDDLKSQLQQLEANYGQLREALKLSGIARQVDYQELKKKKEETEKLLTVISSVESVLEYYKKIDDTLVEKIIKNGYIQVSGVNGGISQLSDNDPERLAELLGKLTNHEIIKHGIDEISENFNYRGR